MSAQSLSDRIFWKSLRVMDVRAFGSWMSAPKCLFSRILTALTEVLGRDISAQMTPGCPRDVRPKNSLFGLKLHSFLIEKTEEVGEKKTHLAPL